MTANKQLLADDRKHFQECHERWSNRRNRNIDSGDYKDVWYAEQCFNCKFFVSLSGAFIEDYGACTNDKSSFDKQIMFEHDGCEHYVFDENY